MVKEKISSFDDVYSTGLTVSGQIGHTSGGIQLGIAADKNGDVYIYAACVVNESTSNGGWSITNYHAFYDAPSAEKVIGHTSQSGIYAGAPIGGVPVAFGMENSTLHDWDNNEHYEGISMYSGVGSSGASLYNGGSYSVELHSFNLFSLF